MIKKSYLLITRVKLKWTEELNDQKDLLRHNKPLPIKQEIGCLYFKPGKDTCMLFNLERIHDIFCKNVKGKNSK